MSARSAHTFRALSVVAGLLVALTLASCSTPMSTAPAAAKKALGQTTTSSAGDLTTVDGEVVIGLAPNGDPSSIASDYDAQLIEVDEGYAVLRSAAGTPVDIMLSHLATDSRVLTAEPNAELMQAEARQRAFSFDDGMGTLQNYTQQPAGESVNLYAAHYASIGAGVLVAILDTGVDPTHPAIASRIAGGWDFVDGDADPTDVRTGLDTNGDGTPDGAWGHGTHVAGIVTLSAPGARLLVVRVLDADGVGTVSHVAAGIRWAVAHGARVINMSLGMLRQSPAIRTALEEAYARGVVCVASAGNWGASTPVEYPAGSPRVLAVAAVDAMGQPAPWTSFGSFVSLSAPGVAVRSAFPGGGYRLWSGTSMSAAFVSGTAALILADHPDYGLADVAARLATSVKSLSNVSSAQTGGLGAGMLDAGAALSLDLGAGETDPSTVSAVVRGR